MKKWSLLLLILFPVYLNAQSDDRRLQAILDSCGSDSICKLPKGFFTLSAPLRVSNSMTIGGAGGGPGTKRGKSVTEIRIREGLKIPAFLIEGDKGDIAVKIQDVLLIGGGIHAGGQKDPCQGIDDPFDLFSTNLTLQDISILGAAIVFEGGSLSIKDIAVSNDLDESGLYVSNATGDVVLIDTNFIGNQRWGVYVCNMEGTGQIFMNDVSASENGMGGIAIVGKGSAPNFRTLCMQNTGAAFNMRFGILLYDVAKSLLFNVQTGFTLSDPDGAFGDGIAVSASDDVYFWDVTTVLNNRSGFFAYGPDSSENTHIHLAGDVQSLNNAIIAAVEGFAEFDAHIGQTTITGLCGFTTSITAPPLDGYCEQGFQEVGCGAVTVGFAPPDPTP